MRIKSSGFEAVFDTQKMRNVEIGAIDREIGPLKSGEKKDRYSK
jgi:hypothetical protein